MTLTNTDCVLKNWRVYKSWGQATTGVYVQVENKVCKHVNGQVVDTTYLEVWVQMYDHHNPIKTKITQEINK